MSDLLEFINANAKVCPIRPSGFGVTSSEYRESKGRQISLATAQRLLDELTVSGMLEKREMLSSGRNRMVYARPDDWAKLDKKQAPPK